MAAKLFCQFKINIMDLFRMQNSGNRIKTSFSEFRIHYSKNIDKFFKKIP
jgi:hypothetical protein